MRISLCPPDCARSIAVLISWLRSTVRKSAPAHGVCAPNMAAAAGFMLRMQPFASRSTSPSRMLPVTWANSSVLRLSVCICASISRRWLLMRFRSGVSSSYTSFSSGWSRSSVFSGSTMRRDRRFATKPESTSAHSSTASTGCTMPSASTPTVCRLTEMRSTVPSERRLARYIVFCSSVVE